LRLHDVAGGFDNTIAIAGNYVVASAYSVDVCFKNVPKTASYSLTYIGADGQESTIVSNAAFDTLKDDTLPT
jgi:hypothetical protein